MSRAKSTNKLLAIEINSLRYLDRHFKYEKNIYY